MNKLALNKTRRSSEKVVPIYQAVGSHITEGSNFHNVLL